MADMKYGDPIQNPFWAGAGREKLMMQQCCSCGQCQLYGRRTCIICRGAEMKWIESGGRGTVYSMTRVHGFNPARAEAPYVVALVDLTEGPRLMTQLVNGDCAIGDEVKVCWKKRDDAPPLPLFEPA